MSEDAKVIPFPVREPVEYEDERDPDDWSFSDLDGFTMAVATDPCEGCGSTDDAHYEGCVLAIEEDPDEIAEAGGRWVWQPLDESPMGETPVGMVANRIATMCKWTHRHLMEDQPIPQPCCYSVLISTARLAGPVQQHRSWLAPAPDAT